METPVSSGREQRHLVELKAACRTQSGLRDGGVISNISADGCCVETNSLYVKVGVRVLVRPEGMEGLSGVVRWIEGNRAGIRFDVPLYGPVLEHLTARYGGAPR